MFKLLIGLMVFAAGYQAQANDFTPIPFLVTCKASVSDYLGKIFSQVGRDYSKSFIGQSDGTWVEVSDRAMSYVVEDLSNYKSNETPIPQALSGSVLRISLCRDNYCRTPNSTISSLEYILEKTEDANFTFVSPNKDFSITCKGSNTKNFLEAVKDF